MPIYALDETIAFPPPFLANDDGLLAVGGDLKPERLLLAYQIGIFPWYSGDEPILWWSPDPRFVMRPEEIKISKSMKQVLRSKKFTITLDTDFRTIVSSCRKQVRKDQSGTWITPKMLSAYHKLHKLGYAHSVEVRDDSGEIVGGLYGISLGSCFFGESMFAKVSNASKAGYITLARQLTKWGFDWIDCQMYTQHLESLGAYNMSRNDYLNLLRQYTGKKTKQGKWTFDDDFSSRV